MCPQCNILLYTGLQEGMGLSLTNYISNNQKEVGVIVIIGLASHFKCSVMFAFTLFPVLRVILNYIVH